MLHPRIFLGAWLHPQAIVTQCTDAGQERQALTTKSWGRVPFTYHRPKTLSQAPHLLFCAAQAQHDYLSGSYPVVREDAAQMCSLQMQAEAGVTMLDAPELVEGAIERFVTKQARRGRPYKHGRFHGMSLIVADHPCSHVVSVLASCPTPLLPLLHFCMFSIMWCITADHDTLCSHINRNCAGADDAQGVEGGRARARQGQSNPEP